MALLIALAERPGGVWRRSELIDRLWPTGGGSDEGLTRAIYLLRRAFAEHPATGEILVTIAKTGYRLDAVVDRPGALAAASRHADNDLTITVLPLIDHSLEAGNGYLADGMTRDITARLAQSPRFIVTPHSTALKLSQSSGASHPARFIVSGTLLRQGDKIRVRVELADTLNDRIVWSRRYDTALDSFFEVQDDVILSITTAVSTVLNVLRPHLNRNASRFNLSAYELVQAAEALRFSYGREAAEKIVDYLQQALEIEPDNPVARAALAVQLSQNVVSLWVDDPAATMERADAHVAAALTAAPNDPDVLASAGIVATMFHRPDEAISFLEQATRLNPNDPNALAVLGWQLSLRRADAGGVDLIRQAEARAPHHPRFGLWATYRATAHLFLLDHDAAAPACREAIARTPNYYQPHMSLAWALTGLDDLSGARQSAARARSFGDEKIVTRFVGEMKKWSGNSPNRAECWTILDQMAEACAS